MRWFLSITLLVLFGLAAACSSQAAEPTPADAAPPADAQIVVYKSPT